MDGLFAGGGKVPGGGVLEVTVAGRNGVPVDAKAVALNVTVAEPEAAGYVTVWACGAPQPNASTLNYAAGQTVANAAFAEFGDAGKVCFFTEQAAHLIVDVNGTFPATSSFTPTAPARFADTRPGAATVDGMLAGGGKVAAGGVLQVDVGGRHGVPGDAEAVAVNVTVAEPDAAGYVTVWACGTPRPNASNLNYAAGQTVANAAFAELGADGRICLFSERATHLIVDVNGVFPAESLFTPWWPARLADTRAGGTTVDGQFAGGGKVPAGGVLELPVAGRDGVPADADAVALNVTVTEPDTAGYVTVWPCGFARPNASNLNYAAGQTVANAVFAQFGDAGNVCFYSEQATHLIVDLNGVFGDAEPPAPSAPAITSIAPTSGPAAGGTTVTITGTDLIDATAVTFGTSPATFTVDSPTQITATTPAGSGMVDVTVTSPAGTSSTGAAQFTYIDAPAITSIAPTSGPAAGGTPVTITGTNLTDTTAVSFAGAPAAFTVDSATQITATTPAGVGTADVTVSAPGGTATAAGAYTYIAAPAITSITPNSGPEAGGTPVTITGTNLTDATAVTFDGAPATSVIVVSATQITAVSPAGVGTVDVAIATTGGTATAAGAYTYITAPVITAVTPSAGPATGGTAVTITGTGFTGATAVTFAGIPATSFTVDSATQITAITPAGNGLVDVAVTTPGGTDSDDGAYLYVAAPTITSITPAGGPEVGGTSVTISGTNLTDATGVTFGANPASGFTVDSPTQITALTPAGVGPVDVVVTTTGGTATVANGYVYAPTPTIISILPESGPEAGGTVVTITGSGFTGTVAVSVGLNPATSFVVVSDTQLVATTPPGTGAVNVIVTTTGGSATASGGYTYAPTPAIFTLSPTAGPQVGGTMVTISGSGFTATTGVSFGGAPASSFTVDSATQITAVTPAGLGTVDVEVSSPGGSATAVGAYTYVPGPTITSVNPTAGPESGGNTITITGTGFTGATSVNFGPSLAASFTVVSPTQLTATAPAGLGTVDITVTTAGGTATASGAYTYVPAPTITSVTPTAGPESGGNTITITGTGFTGATSVNFGPSLAASFTVVSPTQITATAPAGLGTVDITVTTAGGTATASGAYTYVPAPTITSVTPSAGSEAGGTAVTITGTGFTAALSVTFGANPAASFVVNSATQITATAPAGTSTVDVTVTTYGGTATASAAYTYVPVPTITSVTPDSGLETGGDSVTITGTGFTTTSSVTIDGTPVSFMVISDTTVGFTTPASAPGPADVTVTTAGGTATVAGGFTYIIGP